MASGFLIFLVLVVVYILVILILRRTGLFERLNMSMLGPILMIRTKRGRATIKKISRSKRFWKWFANIGFVVIYLSMFVMFASLILGVIGSTMKEADPIPPSEVLVIPGVNKLVPLTYGTIALIVGIVVHEFSHGILAMVAKVKVKALGLLLLIIPIGAFVEPDDEELKGARRMKRMRVYVAGPMMNIVVGLVFVLVFSRGMMGAVEPVEEGVMIFSLTKERPAERAGMEVGMMITGITVYHNITSNASKRKRLEKEEIALFNSSSTYSDLGERIDPANVSNATFDWLLKKNANFTIEHFRVKSHPSFSGALDKTSSGDKVDVGTKYREENMLFSNITLGDKFDYTGDENDRGKGFLGVGIQDPEEFIAMLHRPVASADSPGEAGINILTYIVLPMNLKVMPFHSPITDTYHVGGVWGLLGEGVFWFLANAFYYIFWLNILIGTFNALPAIPLDGGFIFKDTFSAIMDRKGRSMSEKKKELVTNVVSVSCALLTATMIVFIIFFPYLR